MTNQPNPCSIVGGRFSAPLSISLLLLSLLFVLTPLPVAARSWQQADATHAQADALFDAAMNDYTAGENENAVVQFEQAFHIYQQRRLCRRGSEPDSRALQRRLGAALQPTALHRARRRQPAHHHRSGTGRKLCGDGDGDRCRRGRDDPARWRHARRCCRRAGAARTTGPQLVPAVGDSQRTELTKPEQEVSKGITILRTKNMPFIFVLLLAVVAAVAVGITQILPAIAAGVVGNGTPASCTEASLRAAVAGGGLVTFDCGQSTAAPVTIRLTQRSELIADMVIDGGEKGAIILDGGDPGVDERNGVGLFAVAAGITVELRNVTLTNAGDTALSS